MHRAFGNGVVLIKPSPASFISIASLFASSRSEIRRTVEQPPTPHTYRTAVVMAACSSHPRHSVTHPDQWRASRRHHSSRPFHNRFDPVKHMAEIPAAH
ncbi:hypothetical protein ACLOJK_023925 [Asimina triloba]